MKIYVAFCSAEIEYFETVKENLDLILAYGDIATTNCIDATDFSCLQLKSSVQAVRSFFDDVYNSTSIDLTGFSNNTFECSIRPTLRYMAALKRLINENDVESVIFFKRNIINSGRVNYYFGEHESQGKVLYSRSVSLQKDLVNYVKEQKINIDYTGSTYANYGLKCLMRDAGVFSFRMLTDMKRSFTAIEVPKKDSAYDVICVVRTVVQFDFICAFLNKTNLHVAVYCGESSLNEDVFNCATAKYRASSNIFVFQMQKINFLLVLKEYTKIIGKYFFLKKQVYKDHDVTIDLTQVVKELIVMSSGITLYKERLRKTLSENIKSNEGMLVSCEQKSPHAYIESFVAREKSYTPIQLMCCDQEANDLPYPVFADAYFVDTLKRKELFLSSWSSAIDKVKFEGGVKLLNAYQNKTIDVDYKYSYCYFSHATECEQNLSVCRELENFCSNKKTKFCIKLHPRDNGKWIKNTPLSNVDVIKHGSVGTETLFSLFNVAVSNPSGVVMDLLCNDKKFIFLDILASYNKIDYVYVDLLYPGVITDLNSLKDIIESDKVTDEEVTLLKNRVFGKQQKVFDLDECLKKMVSK